MVIATKQNRDIPSKRIYKITILSKIISKSAFEITQLFHKTRAHTHTILYYNCASNFTLKHLFNKIIKRIQIQHISIIGS